MFSLRPVRIGCFLLNVILLTAGCDAKKLATISGRVAYEGEPVTEGSVHFFMPERGIGIIAKIDPTGNYAVETPIEAGTYKVHVSPPLQTPLRRKPGERGELPEPSKIPPLYRDPETSDLSIKVQPGRNEFHIEMVTTKARPRSKPRSGLPRP